jgi:hypothetical protein
MYRRLLCGYFQFWQERSRSPPQCRPHQRPPLHRREAVLQTCCLFAPEAAGEAFTVAGSTVVGSMGASMGPMAFIAAMAMARALRRSLPIPADALIRMPTIRMAIRIARTRRLLAGRIVWRTARIASASRPPPHLAPRVALE